MKINLGSGKRDLEGYTNIDAVKQTNNTVIGDLLNLNYENNSVDEIFSEHVIEHFTKNELDRFFSECKRVLKIGGKLNIIAPSMVSAIDQYVKGEIDIVYLENFLFALQLHEYDYHKQGIYKEKLEMLCNKHGFEIIEILYQDRDFSKNEIVLEARK